MKRTLAVVMGISFILAGAGASFGMHHEVKIQQKEMVGNYVTDSEGKTLYWFKRDSVGKSACAGPCLDKWPIFFREKVAPPEGINGADFGTIERADGKKQTTFRGYPLYYWFGDKNPGDTTGAGVNNVWYVIDPGNFPPK